MSLALNLRSPYLTTAYRSVLDGNPDTNWALFTYQGANELRVQGTGSGGLEELEEEFSDGRSVSTPIQDRLSLVTEACSGFNTPS
jgi:drebrin-like protein